MSAAAMCNGLLGGSFCSLRVVTGNANSRLITRIPCSTDLNSPNEQMSVKRSYSRERRNAEGTELGVRPGGKAKTILLSRSAERKKSTITIMIGCKYTSSIWQVRYDVSILLLLFVNWLLKSYLFQLPSIHLLHPSSTVSWSDGIRKTENNKRFREVDLLLQRLQRERNIRHDGNMR